MADLDLTDMEIDFDTTTISMENALNQGLDIVSLGSSKDYRKTGRPSTQLYLSCDPDTFSEYQVLVRKNIELFEAKEEEVASSAQGRNKPIVLGQVGIRCMHCAVVPPRERSRGAMYYPSKLFGLYQAAQNLANGHLVEGCPMVPDSVRAELVKLKAKKSAAGGGKVAWAERTTALGVFEDSCGLRFAMSVGAFAPPVHETHG
jgi:hypothetical protein